MLCISATGVLCELQSYCIHGTRVPIDNAQQIDCTLSACRSILLVAYFADSLNNRLSHLIQTLLHQIQLRKPRIGINNQYHSYTSNYSLLDPSHKLHPTDLQQRTGIDHWTALGLQLTKPTSTMKKATTTTFI